MLPSTFLQCFDRSRLLASLSILTLASVLLMASALTPRLAQAQYMYLDSNGDGVHTAADVISATGSTLAKIYLRTNRAKDGSLDVCPTGSELTISSYEVSLRAVGGTVTFSNATNLQASYGLKFGNQGNNQEYYIGYAGSQLPPGDYLLAQVELSVASGTPSIEIVPSAPTVLSFSLTSFGSICEGVDFDNTMMLGRDWFDVDGLTYSPGSGASDAPVVSGPAHLSVRTGENASADFSATDANGDLITLAIGNAPGFVALAKLSSIPGQAAVRVHAFPLRGDAGVYEAAVTASDGVNVVAAPLRIEVQQGPDHPPTIRSLGPIKVVVGGIASIALEALDSDGDPFDFGAKLRGSPNERPWSLRCNGPPRAAPRPLRCRWSFDCDRSGDERRSR